MQPTIPNQQNKPIKKKKNASKRRNLMQLMLIAVAATLLLSGDGTTYETAIYAKEQALIETITYPHIVTPNTLHLTSEIVDESRLLEATISKLTNTGFTYVEATCMTKYAFKDYSSEKIAQMLNTGNLSERVNNRMYSSIHACVSATRQTALTRTPIDIMKNAYLAQGFHKEEVDCIFTKLKVAHGGKQGVEIIIAESQENEEFYLGLSIIILSCLTHERQKELAHNIKN